MAASRTATVLRRQQILDAALEMIEEVGVERLSMRSIAAQLELAPMTLYRHLANKEELLDELVGSVLAHVTTPARDLPWEQRLQELGSGLFEAAVAHPKAFNLVLTRPYRAADAVRVMTETERVLEDAGVDRSDRARLERLVSTALIGFAAAVANRAFWSGTTPDGPPMDPAAEVWKAELQRNLSDLAAVIRMNTARSSAQQVSPAHHSPDAKSCGEAHRPDGRAAY